MFLDAARDYDHYELDTEVVDLEDTPIARPRVDTKDLAMHVHIDGLWHRMDGLTLDASCGLKAHFSFARRSERFMEHPMSESCGCFTSVEIQRASEAYRRRWGFDFAGGIDDPRRKP